MERFKSLWAWMIIPMIIMQAGIFYDYWGDFARNTWAVHVHYWIASLWYLMLITQPFLYAKGAIASHRTWGMVGVFLAGAMAFLSISQLNRDLVYANFVRENPGGIGPFEPWFFVGIMIVELVLISGFIVAIMMAIIQRKSTQDHAWWMVVTVFIIMMPATARGLQAVWIAIYGFSPEIDIVVMPPIYLSQVLIIAMILGSAGWFGKLRHPATWLAVGVNAVGFLMEPLGRSETLQTILSTIVKA
ncbi:MAG: hypothetical protein HRU11_05495 [Parvularculaceae bacterium]|nr:hypothetical protein [Parvularculaceae bacterium]